MSNTNSSACELCNRRTSLTFHHLIPRKVHRRTFFRKNFSKKELNRGINVCRMCHSGIHKTYDEMILAKHFNTVQLLRNDEQLKTHFAWVAKQKTRG